MAKKENGKNGNLGIINVIAIVIIIAVVGVGAGLLAHRNQVKVAAPAEQEIAGTQTIAYDGVEGQTALELLKINADVQTQDSSLGTFVTAIDGVSNSEDHFWIYYVNGEMGTVGADQYTTKSTDKIEWRYDKF